MRAGVLKIGNNDNGSQRPGGSIITKGRQSQPKLESIEEPIIQDWKL